MKRSSLIIYVLAAVLLSSLPCCAQQPNTEQLSGSSTQNTPSRITAAQAQGLLLSQVAPEYPILARQARIQGRVTLDAVIGKDGAVRSLSVASGHPLLVRLLHH